MKKSLSGSIVVKDSLLSALDEPDLQGSIETNNIEVQNKMAKPISRLYNLLRHGKPVLSTFMALPSLRAAQVVARTGLDSVIIDCEHGCIGDRDMHDMVSGVAGSGVSPIVRTQSPALPIIKKALDTGAHGILVPMINTAAEARSVVAAAKLPPAGVRGQGSAFSCFELGMDSPAEYVAQANASIITMVQIESKEGLANVNEICQVDGIGTSLTTSKDPIYVHTNKLFRPDIHWSKRPFIGAARIHARKGY